MNLALEKVIVTSLGFHPDKRVTYQDFHKATGLCAPTYAKYFGKDASNDNHLLTDKVVNGIIANLELNFLKTYKEFNSEISQLGIKHFLNYSRSRLMGDISDFEDLMLVPLNAYLRDYSWTVPNPDPSYKVGDVALIGHAVGLYYLDKRKKAKAQGNSDLVKEYRDLAANAYGIAVDAYEETKLCQGALMLLCYQAKTSLLACKYFEIMDDEGTSEAEKQDNIVELFAAPEYGDMYEDYMDVVPTKCLIKAMALNAMTYMSITENSKSCQSFAKKINTANKEWLNSEEFKQDKDLAWFYSQVEAGAIKI